MVCLRKIQYEDLEMIMHWRMLPEITKHMYTDPDLTMEKQIQWYEQNENDKNNYSYIIEVDEQPVGVLNITDIDRKNRKCSWGYYIAIKEKSSLPLVMTLEWNVYVHAFEDLHLNKVEGEIFTENKHVIRIHQMCGSDIEGVRRQHICKNGIFYDVTVTGICKDKWEKIKNKHPFERLIFPEG